MIADTFVKLIASYAKVKYPNGYKRITNHLVDEFISITNYEYCNYIQMIGIDKLNNDLNITHDQGGIFASYEFRDKSMILLTCIDGIAIYDPIMKKAYFPNYEEMF